MAGMPSSAASSAATTARSMESRSTPGMEAIGCRDFLPSATKIGQIKLEGESEVSAIIARDHAACLGRLSRVAG